MENISPKFRLTALLLGLMLGAFGAHRFYVRKIGTGMIQLLLTLSVIGLLVSSWWIIIDWIMIAAGTFQDKDGRYLTRWTRTSPVMAKMQL